MMRGGFPSPLIAQNICVGAMSDLLVCVCSRLHSAPKLRVIEVRKVHQVTKLFCFPFDIARSTSFSPGSSHAPKRSEQIGDPPMRDGDEVRRDCETERRSDFEVVLPLEARRRLLSR